MFQTISKLYEAKMASPLGLYRLLSSVLLNGTNLMALLRFAAKAHKNKIALVDENGETSYKDLYQQSIQLAQNLQLDYQLGTGKKVAILCRNQSPLVKSLFALSYLGVDVYLLNPEMSLEQLKSLVLKYNFDALVYDLEVWQLVQDLKFNRTALLSQHLTFTSMDSLSKKKPETKVKIAKSSAGKLIILTGGTTGDFKTAVRKPSVSNFLNPFFALLNKLSLQEYQSVYIATPIYHGFGLASLLMSIALGPKIVLTKRFDVWKSSKVMLKHRVQVLILVPLMLQRLMEKLSKIEMVYVRCILAGGAPLNPVLVQKTFDIVGHDLANLYGTSEAGFCIMATTEDLKNNPNTIGKKIKGSQLKILDNNQLEVPVGKVGTLHVQSSWTMKNTDNAWISTGDLAYVDNKGCYFLCGRIDDMIVSGGENVYPVELEHILLQHEAVNEVAVVGITDQEFGQRLQAFVVLKPKKELTEIELKEWLKEHAARYQQPKYILFKKELPVTALGKVNKKALIKEIVQL